MDDMTQAQFVLVNSLQNICDSKGVPFQPVHVAADVMTTDVKTLTLDHTVKAFLDFMARHKIRHAPIVDFHDGDRKNPCFIGIVSQRDVLRLTLPYVSKVGGQTIDQRALRQLLEQLVARNPKSASPQTPVPDVITTMVQNRINMVPVLDDSKLVGIITTSNIVKLYTKFETVLHKLYPELAGKTSPPDQGSAGSPDKSALFSWLFQTVRQIMTKNVICLHEQDELAEAMRIMQTHKLRHLPILDESDKLIGIVSDRDILRHLPFAGRRPPTQPTRFREHLFRIDRKTANLQLSMGRIMTRKTAHISPDLTVCQAAKTIRRSKIDCLPVLDEQNNICGLVTLTDLMRALLPAYGPTAEGEL